MKKWLPEEEQIIRNVLEQYHTTGQPIQWTEAFRANPKWEQALKANGRTHGSIFAKGHQLVRQLAKEVKRERRAGPRAARGWTDEQNEVLDMIIRDYLNTQGKKTFVDFKKAFAEHPEYLQTLNKGLKTIYNRAQARVRQLNKEKSKGHAKTKIDNGAVDIGPVVSSPVTGKPFEVNGCPNCLLNVKIMNDAYEKAGMQPPAHCPNCTFPLGIARTAIRLAHKHSHFSIV